MLFSWTAGASLKIIKNSPAVMLSGCGDYISYYKICLLPKQAIHHFLVFNHNLKVPKVKVHLGYLSRQI